MIVNQLSKEREDFTRQYLALEKVNDDLRSGNEHILYLLHSSSFFLSAESVTNMDTISELNQELLAMQQKTEQTSDDQEEVRELRENVASLTNQLDERNRAWEEYQQTQVDVLRNELEKCLSLDYNGSFDDIAQQIADQVTKEREDFREKYEALEILNNDLRSSDNTESIRETYMNTVNNLNQELLAMKDAYDQLDNEKQLLANTLQQRGSEVDQEAGRRAIGMFVLSYIR